MYTAAKAAMILLRGALLPVSFLVRVLLLFREARLVCGARFSCRLAFFLHPERASDELAKTLFGRLTIAQLAARVARDNSHRAFFAQAGTESRCKKIALFIGEGYGAIDVP